MTVVSQTKSNQQAILAGVILAVASLGTESNSPKNVRSGRRVHQTLEIQLHSFLFSEAT